jgi:hypothetical protein
MNLLKATGYDTYCQFSFNSRTFCTLSVFMCFVWISEQTAIISLCSINWLVCITETECVYCAVRNECLNTLGSFSSLSVIKNNRFLFWDPHETHKRTVWAEGKTWRDVKEPLGFTGLRHSSVCVCVCVTYDIWCTQNYHRPSRKTPRNLIVQQATVSGKQFSCFLLSLISNFNKSSQNVCKHTMPNVTGFYLGSGCLENGSAQETFGSQ